MAPEKVRLTEEKETMLITLYARALESQSPNPILRDPAAEAAIGRINYDFGRLKLRRQDAAAIAARARVFDNWAANFLAGHPRATVLHLGCGLDSRVERLNPPASVLWFDVDYPEVIALRRQLFPERPGYRLIGAPVTEAGWLDQAPAERPALIVAEGLLYYLAEAEVKALLRRVVERFPGGELMFDAVCRRYLRLQKRNLGLRATGARMTWGLDDPRQLERWRPGVRLVTQQPVVHPTLLNRTLPVGLRYLVRLASLAPAVRGLGVLLRYRFGKV
jgi:methyltransferase (TIGR00027 family)